MTCAGMTVRSIPHIGWQIMREHLLRHRTALLLVIWSGVMCSLSTLLFRSDHMTLEQYTKEVSIILTQTTFFIATLLSIWGIWTRIGKTHFQSFYLLLPVGMSTLVLLSFLAIELIFIMALVIGIIPAMFFGIDFGLFTNLPYFATAIMIGLAANWCRLDLRFILAIVPLTIFLAELNGKWQLLETRITDPSARAWVSMLGTIVFLLPTSIWVVTDERKGMSHDLWQMLRKVFLRFEQGFGTDSRKSLNHQANWSFRSSSVLYQQVCGKRVIWLALLTVMINLTGFFLLCWHRSDVWLVSLGLLSIALIAIASLLSPVPRRSDLGVPSYLSVLPVPDRKLALSFLIGFYLSLGILMLTFFVSIALPLTLGGDLFDRPTRSLRFRMVPALLVVSIALSLIYTLINLGRRWVIATCLLTILAFLAVASIAVTHDMPWLLKAEAIFLLAFMAALWLFIAIFSLRRGLFVWWAHGLYLILCMLQVQNGYDLLFYADLQKHGFYGLVGLPGLPLIAFPVGLHLNRHR